MIKLWMCLLLSTLLLHQTAFSDELTEIGTRDQIIPALSHDSDKKEITVLEYALSDQLQSELYQQVQSRLEQPSRQQRSLTAIDMPLKIQLGMEHVPVLDQGKHGSCVVFATTAALDAALHKGNYISQLCLLQLGNYLEFNGQGKSGWQGMSSTALLDRIATYGIMSRSNQHRYSCGGFRLYPYSLIPQTGMSPEEYSEYQEKILSQYVTWTLLFHKSNNLLHHNDSKIISTKQALSAGSRVVVGALLPRLDLGTMGAVGTHHVTHDTWVLTHDIAQELQSSNITTGHEMIITGYDDHATARDSAGHAHQGLFTLRNSWGWSVGDWGDFYMSYDYFNTLVMHGIVISEITH